MAVYRGTVQVVHPSLGGVGTNTWHCRTVGEFLALPESAALQSHTDSLETLYNGFNDVLAGGTVCSFDGSWIRIDDDSSDIHDVDGWTSTSGTSVAPLPPANCLCISWRTPTASKRGRGRTFVGPIGTNVLQADGTPTEALRTTLVGHATAFINTFEGAEDGAFGVWSQVDSVLRDFVAASVSNKFAVLRSRRD
jgi:hypothetical protein